MTTREVATTLVQGAILAGVVYLLIVTAWVVAG